MWFLLVFGVALLVGLTRRMRPAAQYRLIVVAVGVLVVLAGLHSHAI